MLTDFAHLRLGDQLLFISAYGLVVLIVALCAMFVGPDLWREGRAWIFETFRSDPPSEAERDALGTLTQIGGRERVVPFVATRQRARLATTVDIQRIDTR